MSGNKGLEALHEHVIQKDLCVACGACASLCPYLRGGKDGVIILNDCDLSVGRCFDYCPRGQVDLEKLNEVVFGQGYQDVDMGPFRKAVMARAKDRQFRQRGQTGGVVSALMDFALRSGFIDAAILTKVDKKFMPHGTVARTTEEVLACAGSSYVSGPTLEILNKGPWEESERLGLVALPCQVQALANMRASEQDKRTPVDQIALVLGLFCTWALNCGPFMAFIRQRVENQAIRGMDITPPPERLLKVVTEKKTWSVSLEEIRPFIRAGCAVCLDMTAELADLSVGTVEGIPGWNTVLVRREVGDILFSQAVEEGVIETEALPKENLEQLREASLLKKQRALSKLEAEGGLKDGYLIMPPNVSTRIGKKKG